MICFKIENGAKLPQRAHEDDSGLDLALIEDVEIAPFETKVVHTGVHAVMERGFDATVLPRSSISKRGILVHTGTVDQSYTGEIGVTVTNLRMNAVYIKAGERIAQLVIRPVCLSETRKIDSLPVTDRGAGGYGSTGK